MQAQDRIRVIFDQAIAELTGSQPYQDLLLGRASREGVRAFIRHLFLPHYQSAHILAFAYALLASEASELIKENLLEELGEQGGEAHPKLLLKLARGVGFSEAEVAGLIADSQEQARRFCAQQIPFSTLRDTGLAILLETASFEHLLSRESGTIARAMRQHYAVPNEALEWFDLHGELDVRHAEESLTVLREYLAFHQIDDAHLERIARAAFATNPFLRRYFPRSRPPATDAPLAQIAAIAVYRLSIPFREAFKHAQFERAASDAIVVRVTDVQGNHGFGEALPRDYVTGESAESVVMFIKERLAPWVWALEPGDGPSVWQTLADYGAMNIWGSGVGRETYNTAAFCAVELALLDWAFRRTGESVASRLPARRGQVVYSGVVSAEEPEAAAGLARRFVEGGLNQLKLKVGVGDDAGRLHRVREAVGDRVRLRVDANGAWGVDQAIERIRALLPFDIEAVEQPVSHLHPDHAAHLRHVREHAGVPIIVDESLVTLADADALAAANACDVFNVRVSKNGGLIGAAAIARRAREAGIAVQVGAQVGETALLTAAGRHLAASMDELTYAEGSFGTWLLAQDISREEVRFGVGGAAPTLNGPGLGVTVDEEALARLAIEQLEFKR
jgi:L-Ala-D/L-Glu epimerase